MAESYLDKDPQESDEDFYARQWNMTPEEVRRMFEEEIQRERDFELEAFRKGLL